MKKAAHVFPLPDDSEPVSEIIARKCRTFERQASRRKAERWLPITVDEAGPFGLLVVGDEHIDDNYADWPQLLADLKLARETPGVYACAMGDATNNWVGRLIREYADQSTTRKEARALAKWLLSDDAAPWLFRLIGNHDKWNEGDVIIGLFADSAYHVADWEARIELRAAGQRFRIHASHDFKGSSIWNKTHGPLRAAMLSGGAAELYLCGHKHTLGTQSFEIEETGQLVHVARARGYKAHDMYAVTNGYAQGKHGASVFILFDPFAESAAGRITIFNDPAQGCKVLRALRAKDAQHVDRSNGPGRRGKKHSGKASSGLARGKGAPVRGAAKADGSRAGNRSKARLRHARG